LNLFVLRVYEMTTNVRFYKEY